MVNIESLWNILREFGHRKCLRHNQAIPRVYVTQYISNRTDELCKMLQAIGCYLKEKKECDTFSVYGNSGFAELQCLLESKRCFGLAITYRYSKGYLNPDIRWLDVDDEVMWDMHADVLVRSSRASNDNIYADLYDLCCIYLHRPPIDTKYIRGVDGHFQNSIYTREDELSRVAHDYANWNTRSVITGKSFDKFPIPMLFDIWAGNYTTLFFEYNLESSEAVKLFTWNWDLNNMNYSTHVMCVDTALQYHGMLPRTTWIPTFWTQDRLLNKVSLPFVSFMYCPVINTTTAIEHHPTYENILIPSVERSIVEMLSLRNCFDDDFQKWVLHSYNKEHKDPNLLYRVRDEMKTEHSYLDVSDELIERCIYM